MNTNDTERERKWLISVIQDRYAWLTLTAEQAEKIVKYEQTIVAVHSDNALPTMWEEKEIESYFFRQVLTEKQFILYTEKTESQLRDAEGYLAKSDAKVRKGLQYHTELLTFYKETYVAKALELKEKHFVGKRVDVKARIDFLKGEYNEYLKRRLKELYVSHFRYARNFSPNQFREELLRHEVQKVFPDWYFFVKGSDPAINEMGKSLLKKMNYHFDVFKQFYETMSSTIKTKTEGLMNKYYGNEPRGATIVIDGDRSRKQQEEDLFLSFLLVDDKKYEWDNTHYEAFN